MGMFPLFPSPTWPEHCFPSPSELLKEKEFHPRRGLSGREPGLGLGGGEGASRPAAAVGRGQGGPGGRALAIGCREAGAWREGAFPLPLLASLCMLPTGLHADTSPETYAPGGSRQSLRQCSLHRQNRKAQQGSLYPEPLKPRTWPDTWIQPRF